LSLEETDGIVARLRERFPFIQAPPAQDICYATENRQQAVKAVAPNCDMLLVVGSQNSSNSRRLVEVCRNAGIPAYLIDDKSEVQAAWLEGVHTLAVTAGASAPESLVQDLIVDLGAAHGFDSVELVEVKDEDVRFSLPAPLAPFASRLVSISA
jgi:4-hydroxy-3-methylbut-2-enyl diphosphate reductase